MTFDLFSLQVPRRTFLMLLISFRGSNESEEGSGVSNTTIFHHLLLGKITFLQCGNTYLT